MRQVNYQKREVLEIKWEDTSSWNGWHSDAAIARETPAPCRSIGYFHRQNKNSITISKSLCDNDGDGLDPQTIPKGCIKKITRWKGSKK